MDFLKRLRGRRFSTEAIYEGIRPIKITTFIRTLSKLKRQGKIHGDKQGNFWFQLEDHESRKLTEFLPRKKQRKKKTETDCKCTGTCSGECSH